MSTVTRLNNSSFTLSPPHINNHATNCILLAWVNEMRFNLTPLSWWSYWSCYWCWLMTSTSANLNGDATCRKRWEWLWRSWKGNHLQRWWMNKFSMSCSIRNVTKQIFCLTCYFFCIQSFVFRAFQSSHQNIVCTIFIIYAFLTRLFSLLPHADNSYYTYALDFRWLRSLFPQFTTKYYFLSETI
jgi:hypothetical protein